MKGMVLKEFGKPLVYEEVPDPKPGPRQVLVESKANGLCATDLKLVDGLIKSAPLPLMLGHENAGVVVETGPEVDSFQPGDRVVVVAKQTCGQCRMCRVGHEEMCLNTPGRMGGIPFLNRRVDHTLFQVHLEMKNEILYRDILIPNQSNADLAVVPLHVTLLSGNDLNRTVAGSICS